MLDVPPLYCIVLVERPVPQTFLSIARFNTLKILTKPFFLFYINVLHYVFRIVRIFFYHLVSIFR